MFARLLLVLAVLFTLAVDPGLAQSTLSGPALGLFYDPQAQAIRPIWGIPGSATAGQPMNLGFPVAAGVVSPSQDYAIVISGEGVPASAPTDEGRHPLPHYRASWTNVVTFALSSSSVQTIRGLIGTPDRAITSPAGKSAALYYRNLAAAEIFTNLPDSPQLSRRVDLSALPNPPDVIAVSEDGALLLAGVSENAKGSSAQGEVFVFTPDTTAPRSIAVVQHASAIAFVNQSHNVLLADDVANSVSLLSDVANGARAQWTFSAQQFTAPDSVQAAQDGQRFLVASSTQGMLVILDASGSNPAIVMCGCAPAELRPLNASMYQITEPIKGLLWGLDAQASDPKVFFVPIPGSSAQTRSMSTAIEEIGRQ